MEKKMLLNSKEIINNAQKIYFKIKKSKSSVCQMGTMDNKDLV